jgi:hypothetical protein
VRPKAEALGYLEAMAALRRLEATADATARTLLDAGGLGYLEATAKATATREAKALVCLEGTAAEAQLRRDLMP